MKIIYQQVIHLQYVVLIKTLVQQKILIREHNQSGIPIIIKKEKILEIISWYY
nr:hypothetical protein [Cressdnaviricota sp.]UOF78320.1 hypothetical protein [Cressdnaviricota sp.]